MAQSMEPVSDSVSPSLSAPPPFMLSLSVPKINKRWKKKFKKKIIVIKLNTGLEKSIEDSRESIATEIKGLRNSHEELKNAVNKVLNKMVVAIAWIEEAEARIGEWKDIIMEKQEAEKKRDTKIQEYEGRIRELSDAMKRNNIRIIGIPEEEETKGLKVYLKKW